MPPKPRPVVRKVSSVSKDGLAPLSAKTDAQAMPPPPLPVPPPPQGILVSESLALSTCLRSAAVKTGQIYRFYADAKRLGINRYAPYPPHSLVSSLGREVEKYDQLCDAMQAHLQRAIVVLKRDLLREENRQKAAAAEAAAKAVAEAAPPSVHSPPSISPTVPEPPPTSPALPEAQQQKVSTLPMRRQSTISLSSLHRPPFPHKLDLSTASLRLNPDDPMLQSGLASPVALAPKSSIPKAAPDFPFGSVTDVDIDLTVGDDPAGVGMHGPHNGDPSIGSSADKPIELDLDLDMNIFDAHPHPNDNIQSGPLSLGEPSAAVQVKQEDHQIDLDFLKSLQPDDPSAMKDDILASLDPGGLSQQASGPGDPAHDLLTSLQASNTAQADTTHLSDSLAPSSSAMLMAGLEAVADIQSQDDNAPHSMSSGTQGYEFDLGMLEQPMDMQDLFNIDATDVEGSDSRPL